jgi:rhodanese-related sulfurtransferase
MKKGYTNVKVVKGGWQAMTKAGFPIIREGKIIFPKKRSLHR